MAYVLYLIGIVCIIGGGWWTAQVWNAAPFTESSVIASVTLSAPGLATIVTGALFLAGGEALLRLAAIFRQTRGTADALERIEDEIAKRFDN